MDRTAIADALAELLREDDPGVTVAVTDRATVGLSQESWFVTVTDATGSVDAVLRLPSGASSARSIVTQRRALQAVADTAVPAPRLLRHRDDADHALGRPWYLMSRVHGEVPVGWHELPDQQRTALAGQALEILAALHATPWRQAELASSLRNVDADPATTAVAWYRDRFARAGDAVPAVVQAGLWWLETHRPDPVTPVLLHNDFRMGNLVVADGRIAGVLDWEHVGVGDPTADLVWCFLPIWVDPGVALSDVIDVYTAATGWEPDPHALRFYTALGHLRLAYYSLMGDLAFRSGRSDDLRLAALGSRLPHNLDAIARTLDAAR